MTARSNGRWNPITNAYSARMMDPEVHTVAEFDMLPGIYGIRLQDAPYSGQPVTISGYTEVTSGAPASGQFRVDYVNNSGMVIFHSSADSASVTVNYYGVGSVITQELLDTIGGSGSGQGAKSYVKNGFFETDVDTDTEESDAAVAITEDTSTPLAGTRSANLAWASHAIGDYAGFDLDDIDEVDLGTRFRLRFYKRDGTGFVQGDLEVVYAYTVGTVETEVNFTFGEFGDELPEGDGYIVAYAEISGSASTLGQIRFKALDNAHDFDIDIDELTFGPISQNSVNAIQDWKPFTMTISATSTAPTKATTTIHDKAQWCRIGDSMAITYTYNHTDNTGAAAGSGIYLYKLPDGYLIDGSKISFDGAGTSNRTIGGVGAAMIGLQASSAGYAGTVVAYDSTSLAISYHEPSFVDSVFQSHGISQLTYSSISITFRAVVPIVGWSSNLVTAEDAHVEYLYNTDTTNADDTTSFGYGSAGSLVPVVASVAKSKRVRSTRSLANASFYLQFQPGGVGPWLDAGATRAGAIYVGSYHGAIAEAVSDTDVDIAFYPSGTTTSTVGRSWTTENGLGTRYRVKVVYNPAAVEVPDVEITKWQPYTPTTQGFGAVAGVEFSWRRVGQCYEVKGRFTTGTVSGDEAQIGLPNGATVGTQISASGVFRVGSIARNNNAGPNAVIATPGDAFVNLAYEGSSPWGLTPRAGNSVLASIELVSFDFSVPIAGL